MAIDPSFILYVANVGSNNLSAYFIEPNTGALAEPSTFATGKSPTSIAIDTAVFAVFVTLLGFIVPAGANASTTAVYGPYVGVGHAWTSPSPNPTGCHGRHVVVQTPLTVS